jgi:hypothetical protein
LESQQPNKKQKTVSTITINHIHHAPQSASPSSIPSSHVTLTLSDKDQIAWQQELQHLDQHHQHHHHHHHMITESSASCSALASSTFPPPTPLHQIPTLQELASKVYISHTQGYLQKVFYPRLEKLAAKMFEETNEKYKDGQITWEHILSALESFLHELEYQETIATTTTTTTAAASANKSASSNSSNTTQNDSTSSRLPQMTSTITHFQQQQHQQTLTAANTTANTTFSKKRKQKELQQHTTSQNIDHPTKAKKITFTDNDWLVHPDLIALPLNRELFDRVKKQLLKTFGRK